MPDFYTVIVTAEYRSGAEEPFSAALLIAEALRAGGPSWPVSLRIEVTEDA